MSPARGHPAGVGGEAPGSQKARCAAGSLVRGWGAADGPKAVRAGAWQGLRDAVRVTCPGPGVPDSPLPSGGPLRPARWAGWGVPQHSARTRAPWHPEIPRESLRLKKKAPLLCSPLYFRFLLIVYFKRVLDRKQFADLGVIPPRVWGAPRLPGRTPVMPGTPARPRRASLLCPEVRLTQV